MRDYYGLGKHEPGAIESKMHPGSSTQSEMNDLACSPDNITSETAEEAVTRLSKLSPIEYDQLRVSEAEKLGVRLTILDEAVRGARRKRCESHSLSASVLPPAPMHSSPVDLPSTLNGLATLIGRHVVVSEAALDIITLWIAHTWVYELFEHTPRLAITSPEKRCGKSTLLAVLSYTCRNPIKADNFTASSIFRAVDALGPLSFLIDEADSYSRERSDELRGILNSGFEASGAVMRVVEIAGELVPKRFATFAPAAIAAIGRLPETIEDRSVPIRLERKSVEQTVMKFRDAGAREHMKEISSKLARWANDIQGNLSLSPSIPELLNDREGDLAVPLLSIADNAGEEWSERCRRSLVSILADRVEDADAAGTGAMLLSDIRDIFAETNVRRMTSADLANMLGKMEERPWAEWKAGKPITASQLARALVPFRIRPHNIRMSAVPGVRKGYEQQQFSDAWARYVPTPSKFSGSEPLHATRKKMLQEIDIANSATDPRQLELWSAANGNEMENAAGLISQCSDQSSGKL